MKIFDPTKSVYEYKKSVVDSRYNDLIEILRNNSIYRNITIPEFVYINDKWHTLEIEYPTYGDGRLALIEPNNFYHNLTDSWFNDDEFIKIVHTLDDLINGDIDDYIDDLYYDIDDQARIDRFKEEFDEDLT